MLDVLEHIPDAVEALKKAYHLLQPGGRMLLTVPAFNLLWTTHDDYNHHVTRYTKKLMIEQANQTRFIVEKQHYLFHWTPQNYLFAQRCCPIGTTPVSLPAKIPNAIPGLYAASNNPH